MNEPSKFYVYPLLAFLAATLLLLSLVEGVIPQLQMFLLGGHILISSFLIKIALLAILVLGSFLHPTLKLVGLPMYTWLLCVGFLIVEVAYLTLACNISFGDVLQSYNAYYLLILIGPLLLAFQGAVSERTIIRCLVFLLLLCATIGIAQSVTGKPILFIKSTDGSFQVGSLDFGGKLRAFSLFSAPMRFGFFCALGGSLGIALSRKLPVRGALLVTVSALACYTTMTRNAYLTFICACAYALVLTFGRKPSRGLWSPLLYLVLGLATIFAGLNSFVSGSTNNLQDAGTLLERIDEWIYYSGLLIRSTPAHQLFGLGICQDIKNQSLVPVPIDSVPLALVLHIGVIGLALFVVLLIKMWLYLRREALDTQQPFFIAAASVWAAFTCAGMFNTVFGYFGAVFALAILCKTVHPKTTPLLASKQV
jgi:hypothetical protein